jgi:DUF4097 and DUF4098 domain-containing protein YvlB
MSLVPVTERGRAPGEYVIEHVEETPFNGGTIRVDTSHGSLSVETWPEEAVNIRATKRVIASSRDEARAMCEAIEIRTESDDGKLRIDTAYPRDSSASITSRSVDYILRVPPGTSLSADCSHSDVIVRGLEGEVDVEVDHGSVAVMDVEAPVTIESDHADVTVERIGGDCRIETGHEKVSVKTVTGNLTIIGNHSDITADGVLGATDLESSHGNIRVIHLEPVGAPQKIDVDHGNITIIIPPESAVDIEAKADHGSIDSNLAIKPVEERHGASLIGSLNGGGVPVKLTTDHGKIDIN